MSKKTLLQQSMINFLTSFQLVVFTLIKVQSNTYVFICFFIALQLLPSAYTNHLPVPVKPGESLFEQSSSIPIKNPDNATDAASRMFVFPTPLSHNSKLNSGSKHNSSASNVLKFDIDSFFNTIILLSLCTQSIS